MNGKASFHNGSRLFHSEWNKESLVRMLFYRCRPKRLSELSCLRIRVIMDRFCPFFKRGSSFQYFTTIFALIGMIYVKNQVNDKIFPNQIL